MTRAAVVAHALLLLVLSAAAATAHAPGALASLECPPVARPHDRVTCVVTAFTAEGAPTPRGDVVVRVQGGANATARLSSLGDAEDAGYYAVEWSVPWDTAGRTLVVEASFVDATGATHRALAPIMIHAEPVESMLLRGYHWLYTVPPTAYVLGTLGVVLIGASRAVGKRRSMRLWSVALGILLLAFAWSVAT